MPGYAGNRDQCSCLILDGPAISVGPAKNATSGVELWNTRKVIDMARNPPPGDGRREDAVRDRSQVFNPKTDRWVKRNSDTGRSWTKSRTRTRSRVCAGR